MFFFFNDTATTEIYTLSLHDALPISDAYTNRKRIMLATAPVKPTAPPDPNTTPVAPPLGILKRLFPPFSDRKSTRLNSSHANISYAVFCLKKKNQNAPPHHPPPSPHS